MANLLQIKRANTSAAPATLSQGELAYTANGGVLFVGDPSTSAVTAIGGIRNPGTLTANQALVANSTSGINQIQVGNVVMVGTTQTVSANGSAGTGGYVLVSGGTGANVYWANAYTLTAFVNTANQYVWSNTHTFQTGMYVGNSTILTISNSSIQYVGNSTTLPTVTIANTGVIQSGNSTVTGAPQVIVANSTGTTTVNAASISTTTLYGTTLFANVSGSYANISGQVNTGTLYVTTSANIASATLANATGVYSTGTINAASHTVGTAAIANATGFWTTGTVNGALISVGATFTANATLVNTAAINVTGQVNTATLYATTSANIASQVQANSTGLFISGGPGAAANGTKVSNTSVMVGNTTVYSNVGVGFVYATANLQVGTVNSTSNGTSVTNTSVTVGNTSFFSYVDVNGLLVSNGTPASNAYVNTSGIDIGTFFAANSSTLSGVSNAVYVNSTAAVFNAGVTTVNAASANVYALNLSVAGNLVVSGTVMTVNTQTLAVNDNVIEVGLNNITTDVVDTGWFSPAGNSTAVWYSGMARIAAKSSNTNPWFWLFGSNTNPNTATTIDTTANSTTATLQAYLVPYGSQSGAFVVNAQAVTITANSTVNVNITANTLTLATGLAATSGGTGRTTAFTTGDLLYASNTTYMSNLAIGTTGQVLQVSSGNLPSWGTLDGGTF